MDLTMVSIVSHTGMGLAKVTRSDRWEWVGACMT